MIPTPSPLHPALVHFPIVLILIGTVVALVAVILRRWHLPVIAAALLTLGALGAVAAAWTGGSEEETAGELSPGAEQILDQHEEWGERTRNVSLVAAFLAIGAASLIRLPSVSRMVSVITACAALGASWCVANTGHYGGQLVYKHGAGINTAAGAAADKLVSPRENKEKHHDDD